MLVPWLLWLGWMSITLQKQKLASSIPSQGTYAWVGSSIPGQGACEKQPFDTSLPLCLPSPLFKKNYL